MPPAPALHPEPALHPDRADQRQRLLNWLGCWVLLPNLPFAPVTLMGGPPRYADILIAGVTGLVARRLPYAGRLAAFIAVMTYLVASFISRMFNMSVTMLLRVAGLVLDMKPATSPEYVVGIGLLVLTLGGGAWLLRRRQDFTLAGPLMGAAAASLLLAGCDYQLSRDTMGAYGRLAPDDAPFTSATSQTRLLELADGKTHILVVIVEAMGRPTDPALARAFERIWQRPELASRYTITSGATPFFGSTTAAELRELCQRWGNYDEIAGPQSGCLPARLAKRGYQTASFHAFTPQFFDRNRWYPQIGLHENRFGADLMAAGASYCPNVFPGACDRDVPAQIAARITRARQPQFVYWLTLNSHLPIVANRELGTADCAALGPAMDADFPMICRLFTIWGDTAAALAKAVTRPDFPPTHILVVGDHMPPFTHQKSRLKFDPAQVPWILLKARAADQPAS